MASIDFRIGTDTRRDGVVCLLLALATLGVFWPILGYGFVDFDDNTYVFANDAVFRGLSPQSIAWAFGSHFGHWHPLVWLSYMTEVEIFGVDPRVHHAVGLFVHVATTLAIYVAFRHMTGDRSKSGVLALLFAIHPLHVEPVAWISSRKDLLSGLFFALTLVAYAAYARAPGRRRMAVVSVFAALGLMSKSMVVTTPFVLLLLDGWPLRRVRWSDLGRSAGTLVCEKAPLFALSLVASILAVNAANAHEMMKDIPFMMRLENGIAAYAFYVEKTLLPTDLAVFYPLSPDPPSGVRIAAILAGGACITALALRYARSRPYLMVGWLWYLGMLVPVSGIVSVAAHAAADRYTYLPAIGLFIVLVWGAGELAERSRPERAALMVIAPVALAGLALLSFRQVSYWESTEQLFEHALSVTQGNWAIHRALASHLDSRGDRAGAVEHYVAALAINPSDYQAHGNLAGVHARQGRFDLAIAHYEQSLELGTVHLLAEGADSEQRRAQLAAVHFDLALALAQVGRKPEARRHRSEAIRFDARYEGRPIPGLTN